MEYIAERITIDPDLCNGKPAIRGKRITVQTILEFLGADETEAEILHQYPPLEPADITACVRFAAQLMNRSTSFARSKPPDMLNCLIDVNSLCKKKRLEKQ